VGLRPTMLQLRYKSPQPTLRTEKDIGSENPEATTVSGFFVLSYR